MFNINTQQCVNNDGETLSLQQKRKYNILKHRNNATNESRTQLTRRLLTVSPIATKRVSSRNDSLYLLSDNRSFINPLVVQVPSTNVPLPIQECPNTEIQE